MFHKHDWELWSEGVQIYEEVVQYRRCVSCGKIQDRVITKRIHALAEHMNSALKKVRLAAFITRDRTSVQADPTIYPNDGGS